MKMTIDNDDYLRLSEIIKMNSNYPPMTSHLCLYSKNGVRCNKHSRIKFGSPYCYIHQMGDTPGICVALNKNKKPCFFKAKHGALCDKHNKQIDYLLNLF